MFEAKMEPRGKGKKRVTEDLHVLLYPTRYEVFMAIKEEKEPLYASQIAEKLRVDRKLVSFHLSSLERHGFVTSTFGVQRTPKTGPPRAVRYYTVTDKADRVLRDFKEELKL